MAQLCLVLYQAYENDEKNRSSQLYVWGVKSETTWLSLHIHYICQISFPVTFFLFPKLKTRLKGKGFATVEQIQKDLHMTKDDYRKNFQEWEKHWDKCIASPYFKGD